MKKNKWVNLILVIVFFIGLSVMLYPTISDYWNSRVQSRAVATYNSEVQKLNKEDYTKMFAEAQEYNEELARLEYPFIEAEDELDGYEDILNVAGTGIMGYITIDKIGVELPFYHGTSEGVLEIAVGHLTGSSLPIGGKGTHAVLSAHRGLPSAKLFTDLDKLEEGDTFTITVLNETLTYQVNQIRIVEPDDTSALAIDPDEDYCTLMTCTPYGINTHRLLVRGTRVTGENAVAYVPADAYLISQADVAIVIMIVLVILMTIATLVGTQENRARIIRLWRKMKLRLHEKSKK